MNYTKPFIDDMKKKGCTQLEYAEGVFTRYTKEQGGKDRIVGKIIEVLEKRLRHSQIEEKTLNGVKKKIIEEGLKKIKIIAIISVASFLILWYTDIKGTKGDKNE